MRRDVQCTYSLHTPYKKQKKGKNKKIPSLCRKCTRVWVGGGDDVDDDDDSIKPT